MYGENASILSLLRTDGLTGAGNILGFYEYLQERFETEATRPFTLVSLDINKLSEVNSAHGHDAGDAAIRWFALVLSEETDGQVYRIGNDEFALILAEDPPDIIEEKVKRLVERLEKEAQQNYLTPPAARIAVINFNNLEEISLETIFGFFYYAISRKRDFPDVAFSVYNTADVQILGERSYGALDMIKKMSKLGKMLDESFRLAYTDSISGLPNMHAMEQKLETAIKEAAEKDESFSILLIDGDNLKAYNEMGYLTGDKMIKQLGDTLKQELRPYDFLARWRFGDEFLIILPKTDTGEAERVGERLRMKVEKVSTAWEFPVSISLGLASYPKHGKTIKELIKQVEKALRKAKLKGKNRMEVA
ncbi:MAG: GGDEF domain-containing protein [Anaerolineales bacterium]|jgi:diguanylate cyclase (GGDEF)-like protein